MDAKELRIGNLVFVKIGTEWEVMTLDAIDIAMIEAKALEAKPIPLAEDLFLNFGFEFRPHLQDFFIHFGKQGAILIFHRVSSIPKLCNPNAKPISLNETHHLHQLQNLYFVITGKELENIHKKGETDSAPF